MQLPGPGAPAGPPPNRLGLPQPSSPVGALPAPHASHLKRAQLNATRRLTESLNDFYLMQQTTLWSEVNLRNDNLYAWRVQFYFLQGSMAEGLAKHQLSACVVDIDFPKDYPCSAPHVHVVEPQISSLLSASAGIYGGTLCLDFLHNWDPSISEETLLVQVHFALTTAQVERAQAYTQAQAAEGLRYIRNAHWDWKPSMSAANTQRVLDRL